MSSGISLGTGLVSGLPTADIIDQLMSIESRPKVQLERRNEILESQRGALQDVSSKLLGLKLSANGFTNNRHFRTFSAETSNENVLTASASRTAVPGNYSFTVKQLVASQQTITRGFADDNTTPVGEGTLTFQRGEARLSAQTKLSALNAGQGVQRGTIRITDRAGAAADIDLSQALTVDDVLDAINSQINLNVTASVDGDQLKLTDHTGLAGDLSVVNLGSSQTATDLGIAGSVSADELVGQQINRIGDSTQLSTLNDGNGIHHRDGVTDFRITDAAGTVHGINITGLNSIGDLTAHINEITNGAITASVGDDGVSLKLVDTSGGGGGSFTVEARNSSRAAADLGIEGTHAGEVTGHRLVAGMNSKLIRQLNGGAGIELGTIQITNRQGATTDVDLADAHSVQDIIDRINAADAGVTAALNDAGNGLALTDTTGGTGTLNLADLTGQAAAQLSLAGDHDGQTADSGNLNFQFITEATRLDKLGVNRGSFTLTDSNGNSATIDLTQGDEQTLGDVLQEINSKGLAVNARINDTGDGILLEDTGQGSVAIKVEEAGSSTARDLGLAGEASTPGEDLNGAFTHTVEVGPDDTLRDVVQKIQDSGAGIRAAIINDGSGASPYRLVLSAQQAGTSGAFVFDDGGLGLGASNLSEAQDAVMFFGSSDPAKAIAITSRSNTVDSAIPGVSIDLKSTSDQPVQLTIDHDNDAVVDEVSGFVDAFNELVELMDEHDNYDSETQERGLLLGDPSIASIRRSIYSALTGRNDEVPGQYKALSQIGLTVGEGAKLELDEEKLRSALQNDRSAVEELFTLRETEENEEGEKEVIAAGMGVKIEKLLDRLTHPDYGPVTSRTNALERQSELNNQRLEAIEKSLEAKRQRLERQFLAMERAMADMQSQGDALAGLQSMVQNMRSQNQNQN
ncbi:MAG: flagellar filament capping protein FliD [Phycisphaeraceae bacterium]